MNDCLYCSGELEEKLVSRVLEYKERWYLVENVPAQVCTQCGEIFYTPQSHHLVLSLLREGKQPVRLETLDVLDAGIAS
jgi:YgiT-type zinc finger domain-containing protein